MQKAAIPRLSKPFGVDTVRYVILSARRQVALPAAGGRRTGAGREESQRCWSETLRRSPASHLRRAAGAGVAAQGDTLRAEN